MAKKPSKTRKPAAKKPAAPSAAPSLAARVEHLETALTELATVKVSEIETKLRHGLYALIEARPLIERLPPLPGEAAGSRDELLARLDQLANEVDPG